MLSSVQQRVTQGELVGGRDVPHDERDRLRQHRATDPEWPGASGHAAVHATPGSLGPDSTRVVEHPEQRREGCAGDEERGGEPDEDHVLRHVRGETRVGERVEWWTRARQPVATMPHPNDDGAARPTSRPVPARCHIRLRPIPYARATASTGVSAAERVHRTHGPMNARRIPPRGSAPGWRAPRAPPARPRSACGRMRRRHPRAVPAVTPDQTARLMQRDRGGDADARVEPEDPPAPRVFAHVRRQVRPATRGAPSSSTIGSPDAGDGEHA